MSNRLIRINELVQREISAFLRRNYQADAAKLTITGVQVAQDLKTAKVHVSVIGTPEESEARMRWLRSKAGEIRHHVGRTVVMKWTPEFEYLADATPERAARVLQLIEEIDREQAAKPTPPPQAP